MAGDRSFAAAVAAAATASLSFMLVSYLLFSRGRNRKRKEGGRRRTNARREGTAVGGGVLEAIGNTPLIKIHSLSDATGCEILGKAEFLNPGGSVKDRVALRIIEEALESGMLRVGGLVTEGSAGSTAVSLAMVASAYGCKCHVVIPDDASIEKAQILEALGAVVERVRPVSISHKDHFVNIARRRAEAAEAAYQERWKLHNKSNEENDQRERVTLCSPQSCVANDGTLAADTTTVHSCGGGEQSYVTKDNRYTMNEFLLEGHERRHGGFFADQFENLANFRAHYHGTGSEIWSQTGGNLHAFVAAAGTGGTLAGISQLLKAKDKSIQCFLIDPPGSSLFYRVTRGVVYTREEAEGKRLKNPFDTITEGIGINRLTQNFKLAKIDGAFQGTDREAVEMARYLVKKEGLFLGSSSAMNCVGAVRVAQMLGPGHTIVTILCDSGMRHLSKFYNHEYLHRLNLIPTAHDLEFLDHN